MANTISAAIAASITATETIDLDLNNTEFTNTGGSGAPETTLKHTLALTNTLNATTTAPASKAWNITGALAAGVKTIDFTSLATYQNQALDLTGLKIQAVMIQNRGSNVMNFATGAANGLDLFGAAADSITLPAAKGSEYPTAFFYFADGIEDIDATHKTIDLAGTGTDTFKMVVVAG